MTAQEPALIRQAKAQLGPIMPLDCREYDTTSAHRVLGQDARTQIHKILFQRMNSLGNQAQVWEQIQRARGFQAALNAKSLNVGLNEAIRAAVRQYQACLSAWAEGARLADFRHPLLAESIAGIPVSAEDLATLLQEDEVGCQTGVIREHSGAVVLWHSEEDYEDSPGQRFDKLRLFLFRAVNGQSACGFIYPDLLPGPTFGWQADDFAQGIDTLHVRSAQLEEAILPNTLAWLSLYLGAQVSRQDLATQLGPFQGGYSLTGIYKKDGQICVEKVEYANNQVAACALGPGAGEYLFQTNVIRDLSHSIGTEEQTSPESRAWNEKRMARTGRLIKVIQQSSDTVGMILRMLRSRLGGESAYSNRDVKTYFVCKMTTEKIFIQVGAGAAILGDKLFSIEM